VLGSLTGPDAEEADRLLTEHVPDCLTCRTTLDAFRGLTGDLGLVADPLSPPETLLPRLQRGLEGNEHRSRLRAWSPARIVAGAAAAVVLLGAAGLALTQGGGAGPSAPLTQADLAQVRTMAANPGAQTKDLGGGTTEIEPPDREALYVLGTAVAGPRQGYTYRLWAVQGDSATFIGDFAPVNGLVALKVSVDPNSVDKLLVTEEPVGSTPSQPGQPAWDATG
jgi:hypothetical protein